MVEQIHNEVLLIGKMISGLHRTQVNNHKACRVLMKVEDNDNCYNVPVVFINPNEENLRQCKNKELSIIGHVETKWGIRIVVDAYKTEDEEDIKLIINQ